MPPSPSALAIIVARLGATLPAWVVGVAALLALHRLDDPDTWWHLASGRWIAQHWAVPHSDVLSWVAPERPWFNLQWLFDLAIYGVYTAGGADLSVLSGAALFAGSIALLTRNVRLTVSPVATACITLWATVIAEERLWLRPELASFLLLQALIWLLATAHRDDGRRLWLLPVITLLWVNIHVLSMVGLFIIGCHMLSAIVDRLPGVPTGWRASSDWSSTHLRHLLLAGTLAAAATIVNPYGLSGAMYPFKLMTAIDGSTAVYKNIGELSSPFSNFSQTFAVTCYRLFLVASSALVIIAGLLAAIAPGRARSGRGHRTSDLAASSAEARLATADLLVFAGLAYLSILARRNIALFALGVAPIVGKCLQIIWARLPKGAHRIGQLVSSAVTVALPFSLAAFAWFVATNGYYRWDGTAKESGLGILEANFPMKAAAFANALRLPSPVYNDVAAGGYLAWASPFDGGVYIDGRLGLSAEFFATYMATLTDPIRWQQEADRRGIRTVVLFHVWSNRHPLIRALLKDPRWSLLYFDEAAVMFVRAKGNEELIEDSNQQFATWNARIVKDLLAPVSSWQWPSGRFQALTSYAAILEVLDLPDLAASFYARALDVHPTAEWEADIRLQLATHYAFKGDLENARRELALAARADPNNQAVANLRARIGG